METQLYYLFVAMIFASCILSVIFFIAWKTQGNKPYAMSWCLGFLAAAAQWAFTMQADRFASALLHTLTIDACALVLITLLLRGHCQRTDCQRLPANLWPFTALIFSGIVWTTFYDTNVGVSNMLVPATACITLILSAIMIVRHRDTTRAAEWAAAVSLLLFGIAQGVAASIALLQGAAGNAFYEGMLVHYNYLMQPSGYMAMGMFVVFMLASDLSEKMKEIAVRDQLTGVLNRHGLTERGTNAFTTFQKNNLPVSIIMIDIDRFKFINDEHGHAVGDAALVHFASLLRDEDRKDDILARVGGEEFALVLLGYDLMSALRIAESLCGKVEATPMRFASGALKMTASFGVAAASKRDKSLTDALVRADLALYRSKHAGRNQVDLESSQLMKAADGTLRPVN